MTASILNFLQMNWGTIVVACVVFAIIILICRYIFVKKQNSCSGNCGSCKGCH